MVDKHDNEIKQKITNIVDSVFATYKNEKEISHISKNPLPSKENIIDVLQDLFDIIYPGFFSNVHINNMEYYIGNKISKIYDILSNEIAKSYRYEMFLKNPNVDSCESCLALCMNNGIESTLLLLESLPDLRRKLALDVAAAFAGDPAAKSTTEVTFSYPSIQAVTIYRVAHILQNQKIPLIPRIMSEYAHTITGIDIHPGAVIGESFFIDHGSGVVIGGTAIIGNNVRMYQGVTLGAFNFPKDEHGNLIRNQKRHPTIEDNVIIYAGATISGGDTIIGHDSIIGGNVWIAKSIKPCSKVTVSNLENSVTIKER